MKLRRTAVLALVVALALIVIWYSWPPQRRWVRTGLAYGSLPTAERALPLGSPPVGR